MQPVKLEVFMFSTRLIIVSILVLVIMVTYSPFAGEEIGQAWKDVRPDVLGFMDSIYAAIRSFVAGNDPKDGVDDNAPGVDFDLIITMDRGFPSKT
jgi:hypothetical protein